ncbi:TetR family transcriptional regulator C-terminal domain-containing protein [Aliiglaciecola sp. LCG003]|uniref:TetR family transcriptional regulator C-terminal domain-containing protein n=1 Tax=Aliiglaciecola sp. LCG003 TaxID=3053655 RepID=UPI002573747B|nr:TetR family transcriptional regulator C-terminal domain-containing protein [Aliiglaciecola sp. LCG003]WJG11219.1 TetR family transcriptional regulator C-terminal domain-containing protein [Aliiglaciecola sp. LCG003]
MTKNKTNKEGRVGAANKQLILRAAEQEFAKNGFKGTRIQQVADSAGLPKTNVLYYYKSKENLYLAVLEQILTLWNSAFDLATTEDDPAEQLAHYITEKMEFSLTRPEASKIFALEVINGAPNLKEFFKEYHVVWMEGRAQVIQGWIDQGKIHTSDPYYLLFHIWACCQHYADFSAQIVQLKGKEMERQEYAKATRALIQLILNGCGLQVPNKYC